MVKQISIFDNVQNVFTYNLLDNASSNLKFLKVNKKIYNVKEDEYSDFSLLYQRRKKLDSNFVIVTTN